MFISPKDMISDVKVTVALEICVWEGSMSDSETIRTNSYRVPSRFQMIDEILSQQK